MEDSLLLTFCHTFLMPTEVACCLELTACNAKEIQMIFSNFAFSIAFAGFINAKALARLGVGSFLSLSLSHLKQTSWSGMSPVMWLCFLVCFQSRQDSRLI